MLSVDVLQRALPAKLKGRISQGLVDKINGSIGDPDTAEIIEENILGYISVIQMGRIKVDDYINAVKYVTYKMMGDANIAAWVKVFPNRYARLRANGVPDKDIHAHVSIYNKNKTVNEIYDRAQIPTSLLNADIFQKAINIQAHLMSDPNVSPKVRSDAANSLLTHLKRPETQKVELDIGIKDDSMLKELKDITLGLAKQQQSLIQSGAYSPKEIAHQDIIEGEVVDG
jgi:hypothetical protein